MKQLDADMAVVGSGFAGLAAAVTAAEGGASTILFEKAARTGGTSNMARGIFGVESRLQRQKMITLTKEEAFKIHMDYTHWSVDARLVSEYYNKAGSTIDWLEKLGVEFSDADWHIPGFNYTWHVISSKGFHRRRTQNEGATVIKILTDKAKELGAQIYLKTPAKRILKEDGRIVGVVAEDGSGEEIRANAKAVVIATGNFGDNPEWIKKYTGYEWGRDLFSVRLPGFTADGIRMAWEVGAAETTMNVVTHGESSPLSRHGLLSAARVFHQPNLVVNLLGERFMNEETRITNQVFEANAITRQKDRCAFVIFDEDTKKHYVETGFDFADMGSVDEDTIAKASNFDAELEQAHHRRITKALDRGLTEVVFVADSLEELCAKTGIELNGLRKTVEEYNKACEASCDGIFHKDPKYLRPIKRPKFYAGKLALDGWTSTGGIKINYKTEVLTKDHHVIPGLYSAGDVANSIYGDTYVFVLPGNLAGFAVNSGRIAGENALDYIKQ